jgi:hypothetical protein
MDADGKRWRAPFEFSSAKSCGTEESMDQALLGRRIADGAVHIVAAQFRLRGQASRGRG